MIKKRGFITTLVVLIITAGALYYFYVSSLRKPDDESAKIAELIFKYPNATVWDVNESGDFCLFFDKSCQPPAKIFFETENTWLGIYSYYKSYLTSGGWSSKSFILTSLPTSIVFTDGASCRIELSPTSSDITKNSKHNRYQMFIYCTTLSSQASS